MKSTAAGVFTMLASFCLLPMQNSNAQDQTMAQLWWANAPQTPVLQIPGTLGEWQQKRESIRQQLWSLLGKMPGRVIPQVTVLRKEDRGDYLLEKFTFDNGAGAVVPGYILLPKGARNAPAILYCHWHGGQYEIGKEELFGTNATPVPPGPALVRQGYVVVAIDAYCFGERNGQGPGGPSEKGSAGEMTASKFNLWAGRSLWGMIVRDDLLALDYLWARPEVDKSRVGVTGISMGATRTWWLMALDDRLKAGVAVCCLTRYQDLISAQGLKYHGIYYFVPGMLNYFDTEAVVSLAAPRPLLFLSGETDAGSPVSGIQKIEEVVGRVYALHAKRDQFQSIIHPGVGHQYTPEMWQRTLEWMAKFLKSEPKQN